MKTNSSREYVEHIVNPHELFLMWKDMDGNRHKIGSLFSDCFRYLPPNSPEIVQAKTKGFEGFPAFDMVSLEHKNPLPIFMRRCPPKDRRDYDTYLKAFALDPNSEQVKGISDFTLLGYTGAYVTANPFNLINPYISNDPPFEFVMQVAGAHHYLESFDMEALVGKKLMAEKEENNKKDKDAVVLKYDNQTFGYIPKGLHNSFSKWIDKNWIKKLTVKRINGQPDHRYAYVFVEIESEL
jgi:hypothetical protein